MINHKYFSLTAKLIICVICVLLNGCSFFGYTLGSALPPGVRSVHVPAVVNKCGKHGVETEATKAIISEFQKDGALRITSRANADAVVEIVLSSYKLEPLRFDEDRSKRTSEYRLKIKADITFRRVNTGQQLRKNSVEGESTFRPAGNLPQAERDAVPACVADLAHDIVESIVEYW
ncbi:MAG: hypothetical protein KAH23_00835 [Kiritimatiellae bacterium]|nr:hypothetical protein [Kiritimatiellia bacterium]